MGKSDSLTDPVELRFLPYIHQLLLCSIGKGLPCYPVWLPCVSPLAPRKSTYRFWQFALR